MKRKFRHKVSFILFRPIFKIFCFFKFGYRYKKFVSKDIKPPYLIYCNHTSLVDCFLLALSFKNKPIYFLATDNIINKSLVSRMMQWLVSPISVKKGVPDSKAVRDIISIRNQGGIVSLFPSGNTTFSGQDTPINISAAKLAKMLKVPLLLYRVEGVYGVDPRWRKKMRKGKSFGEVKQIITPEEMEKLTAEELLERIKSVLMTSGDKILSDYDNKARAEYLERCLFICPNCLAENKLRSEGHNVICDNCNFTAEYTKRLTFDIKDGDVQESVFRPADVKDWFYWQLDKIRNRDYGCLDTDEVIFRDEGNEIYKKPKQESKIEIAKDVALTLYKDRLEIGGLVFNIDKILSVNVQSRKKFLIYYGDDCYLLIGPDRINFYKYLAVITELNSKLPKTLQEL